LRQIFDGVESLMREFTPDEIAVERVFMHRNADSALKLGRRAARPVCGADLGIVDL
jgi:crossover junction endodeoxyribonuclease RuvC